MAGLLDQSGGFGNPLLQLGMGLLAAGQRRPVSQPMQTGLLANAFSNMGRQKESAARMGLLKSQMESEQDKIRREAEARAAVQRALAGVKDKRSWQAAYSATPEAGEALDRLGEAMGWAGGGGDRKTAKDVNGVLRYIDTGEQVFEGISKNLPPGKAPDPPDIGDLTKAAVYVDKRLDSFEVQHEALRKLKTFLEAPGPISDYSAVVQWAKSLDPTSVVRPEEAESVAAAGGIKNRIMSFAKKAEGGGGLTMADRSELSRLTEKMAKIYQDEYKAAVDSINRNLAPYGFDAGVSGPALAFPLSVGQLPPADPNVGVGPVTVTVPPGTPRPTLRDKGLLGQ